MASVHSRPALPIQPKGAEPTPLQKHKKGPSSPAFNAANATRKVAVRLSNMSEIPSRTSNALVFSGDDENLSRPDLADDTRWAGRRNRSTDGDPVVESSY